MSKITQYSRISHHTIAGLTGSTFSIPTSEDFTDGTWTAYDLALSEIGVDEDNKRVYIRVDDELKEFVFQGGTATGGENLDETLAIGNNSGTYSIEMGTGTFIKSDSNSNTIDMDFNFGPVTNGVLISENGFGTTGILIAPNYGIILSDVLNGNTLSMDGSAVALVDGLNGNSLLMDGAGILIQNGVNGDFISMDGSINVSTDGAFYISDNALNHQGSFTHNPQTTAISTSDTTKGKTIISSQNSSVSNGVVNTVILGGSGITASTSNTVYVPDLNIQTGKSISSSNGSSSLQLDYAGAPNTILLGANGLTTGYLFISDTGSGLLFNDGYGKGVSVGTVNLSLQHSVFRNTKSPGTAEWVSQELASVTTTDATVTTIKSYTTTTDTMISVKATINGHDLTNNIAYGSTIYAVFRNDAGTLVQVGTTDQVQKTDFGTATTSISISGTSVLIRVTGEAAKTVKWYSNVEFTQH